MNFIVGLDTGTSSTKAIAYSTDGRHLASTSAGYGFVDGLKQGFNEQDPLILFDAMVRCLNDLVLRIPSGVPIAVCFSTAMHSLILLDESNKPLTNVITWADLRSSREASQLRSSDTGKEIYTRTGTPIHPMSPLCKILWFRANRPELFNRAARFISIKEYFFFRLFNRFVVDYSIASATGLFNIHDHYWDPLALQTAGISVSMLSDVVSPYTQIIPEGMLTGMLPRYESAVFIAGGSDGCLANLGSSAIRSGDASLTIGTSGAVRMLTRTPSIDPKARLFNYVLDEEHYVSGGPINNGGILLKWYATNFLNRQFRDSSDFEWFVDEASEAETGCNGMIFLPYVQGERAPVWDPTARGAFIGIRGDHRQQHMMRAIVEGICFSLFQVTSSLRETLGDITNIYASGGFIRSRKWLQMLSDVFGAPIRLSNAEDASAVGAVIIAMRSMGILSHISAAGQMFDDTEIIYPDMERHRIYMHNYTLYAQLYDSLKFSFTH